MTSRRSLLRTLLFTLAALPAAGLARRASALAAAPAYPAIAPGIHLVNGWVLTTSDLEAIAQYDR